LFPAGKHGVIGVHIGEIKLASKKIDFEIRDIFGSNHFELIPGPFFQFSKNRYLYRCQFSGFELRDDAETEALLRPRRPPKHRGY
ncbi:MAG: hypothetical protein QF754_17815, partial [Alphaproteobacteria bacterium]|nr:hypothetical protein [Alphaproteobacteria bacterium]